MSGLSLKFLPPFPCLSHLKDSKSNEGAYSVLKLSHVFGAPYLLSKGSCAHFVIRGWHSPVTSSRSMACAKLKEKQESS